MRKNTHESLAIVNLSDAQSFRAQTKKFHEAVKTELDQATRRADAVLDRLRERAQRVAETPTRRLVRIK